MDTVVFLVSEYWIYLAVALVSEGRIDPGEIVVRMPGGEMRVTVDQDRSVVLRGPVEEVCTGELTRAMLAQLELEA